MSVLLLLACHKCLCTKELRVYRRVNSIVGQDNLGNCDPACLIVEANRVKV